MYPRYYLLKTIAIVLETSRLLLVTDCRILVKCLKETIVQHGTTLKERHPSGAPNETTLPYLLLYQQNVSNF